MGEIAEWIWESGLLDAPYDDEDFGGHDNITTCRRCGAPIELVHEQGRWRVYEIGAQKRHTCAVRIGPDEIKPIED